MWFELIMHVFLFFVSWEELLCAALACSFVRSLARSLVCWVSLVELARFLFIAWKVEFLLKIGLKVEMHAFSAPPIDSESISLVEFEYNCIALEIEQTEERYKENKRKDYSGF